MKLNMKKLLLSKYSESFQHGPSVMATRITRKI